MSRDIATEPLFAAIDRACEKLPDDFEVAMVISEGCAYCLLTNPDGDVIDQGPVDCEESLHECIDRLVDEAVKEGKTTIHEGHEEHEGEKEESDA
jgi:hypothetical protein